MGITSREHIKKADNFRTGDGCEWLIKHPKEGVLLVSSEGLRLVITAYSWVKEEISRLGHPRAQSLVNELRGWEWAPFTLCLRESPSLIPTCLSFQRLWISLGQCGRFLLSDYWG